MYVLCFSVYALFVVCVPGLCLPQGRQQITDMSRLGGVLWLLQGKA